MGSDNARQCELDYERSQVGGSRAAGRTYRRVLLIPVPVSIADESDSDSQATVFRHSKGVAYQLGVGRSRVTSGISAGGWMMRQAASIFVISMLLLPSLMLVHGAAMQNPSDVPSSQSLSVYSTESSAKPSVFVIGGRTQTGIGEAWFVGANERYDTASNAWSTLPGISPARYGISSVCFDGKVYCFGGITCPQYSGDPQPLVYYDDLDIYDIAAGSWSKGADLPIPVAWTSCAVLDGDIYVAGGAVGDTTSSTFLSRVDVYHPSTDTWTHAPDLPTARGRTASVAVDGRLFVIGGNVNVDPYDYEHQSTDVVECYTPSSNTWSSMEPMPDRRNSLAASEMDGLIYVAGGHRNPGTYLDSALCYDPMSDSWDALPPMSVARSELGVVALDGAIWCIGGQAGPTVTVKTVEILDPSTGTWICGWDMPTSRCGFGVVRSSSEAVPSDPRDVADDYCDEGEQAYLWEKVRLGETEYWVFVYSTEVLDEVALRSGTSPMSSLPCSGLLVVDADDCAVVVDESLAREVLVESELWAQVKLRKGISWSPTPRIFAQDVVFMDYTLDGTPVYRPRWVNPEFLDGSKLLFGVNLAYEPCRVSTYEGLLRDLLFSANTTRYVSGGEKGTASLAWSVVTKAVGVSQSYAADDVIDGLEAMDASSVYSKLSSDYLASRLTAASKVFTVGTFGANVVRSYVEYQAMDRVMASYIQLLENIASRPGLDPALVIAIGNLMERYMNTLSQVDAAFVAAVKANPFEFASIINSLVGAAYGASGVWVSLAIGKALLAVGAGWLATELLFGVNEDRHYLPEAALAIYLDSVLTEYCHDYVDSIGVTDVVDHDVLSPFRQAVTLSAVNSHFFYRSLGLAVEACNWWPWENSPSEADKSYLRQMADFVGDPVVRDEVPLWVPAATADYYTANCRGIAGPSTIAIGLDRQVVWVMPYWPLYEHATVAVANPSQFVSYSNLRAEVTPVVPYGLSFSSSTIDVLGAGASGSISLGFKSSVLSGFYCVPIRIVGDALFDGTVYSIEYRTQVAVIVTPLKIFNIFAHSPIHLTVVSGTGEYTGWNTSDGLSEQGIAGSFYSSEFVDDEVISLWDPAETEFTFIVSGKSDGVFGLTVEMVDFGNGVTSELVNLTCPIGEDYRLVFKMNLSDEMVTQMRVVEFDIMSSLSDLIERVSEMPLSSFRSPSEQTKSVLLGKLSVLDKLISESGLARNSLEEVGGEDCLTMCHMHEWGTIMKLANDVIRKVDGTAHNAWIVDEDDRLSLYSVLSAYLQWMQSEVECMG